MTDYGEEQRNELEALESIYPDSFTVSRHSAECLMNEVAAVDLSNTAVLRMFKGMSEEGLESVITWWKAGTYGLSESTAVHWNKQSHQNWESAMCGGVLSENPPSFTITVTSEAGENDETVQTTLKFTYSEKYPDEAPLYEIFSQENLEDNDVSDILKLLASQAEENLGMVMIFTLVTAVQEKLNEIVDQIKTRREEEKKQKEKEAEEAEKKLFHGTPVTIENFLSWKAKFDAELLEMKKKRMKEEEQAGKNKLSGVYGAPGLASPPTSPDSRDDWDGFPQQTWKQLFETDHNLDTSDIQFLEDAGNNVEVDESLFQEMDDLELEDGEDDPDYNPVAPGSDSSD
ncbi:RWD domain-containing protein 1 [Apodemus speciosus]|uniref:RWD domain-containing protein 1 n=1 Tax=Apodemus speciosus TaxID=105296 RepID=A0ABQ0F6W2_APOSI